MIIDAVVVLCATWLLFDGVSHLGRMSSSTRWVPYLAHLAVSVASVAAIIAYAQAAEPGQDPLDWLSTQIATRVLLSTLVVSMVIDPRRSRSIPGAGSAKEKISGRRAPG